MYIYSFTFRHSANTHFLFPVITEWLHDWIQSPWGGEGNGEVESLTWATNTWPWSSGRCALWAPLGWRTSRRPHPVKHKRPVIMTRTQHHGNVCSVFRNNVYTDIKRENEQRLCGGARDGGKTKMMFDKIKQKSQMDHQRDVSAFELQRLTVLLHKSVECYSSSPTHDSTFLFYFLSHIVQHFLSHSECNDFRPHPAWGTVPADQCGGTAGGFPRCDGPCPLEPCAPAQKAAAHQEWSFSGQIYWMPSSLAACHPATLSASLGRPATDKTLH